MRQMAPPKKRRRSFPLPNPSDHPLLRLLLAEAMQREDTLKALAQHLGVTPEWVGKWRSKEADISKASRAVLNEAAAYLGMPVVAVLCMAGIICLSDLVAPGRATLQERVLGKLRQLRQDPYLAGFFPEALMASDPTVQHFVAFLYSELSGGFGKSERNFDWMRAIQLAAMGDVQAQADLASLEVERDKEGGLF